MRPLKGPGAQREIVFVGQITQDFRSFSSKANQEWYNALTVAQTLYESGEKWIARCLVAC